MSEVKVTPAYATGELRFEKRYVDVKAADGVVTKHKAIRMLQQKYTVPMQDGTTQIVWIDIPEVEKEIKDESRSQE